MKIFLPATLCAMILVAASCTARYDVSEADRLTDSIEADSVFTQHDYGQMIDLLDDGYNFMRVHVARAAFESDPSKAVTDFINFMGDSTLKAVERNSRVMIERLEEAPLDKANAARFRKILRKYELLRQSLGTDTVPES